MVFFQWVETHCYSYIVLRTSRSEFDFFANIAIFHKKTKIRVLFEFMWNNFFLDSLYYCVLIY